MRKKGTILALAGFILGLAISILFRLTRSSEGLTAAYLPHLLIGGIYGAAACVSSLIYEIEKWSIARITATHFLSIITLYCLVAFSMGWFTLADPVFWITIGIMAIGYFFIWLFMYLSWRRKIQRMNASLEKWKSQKERD